MSLFAGNDREQLRAAWRSAWQRHRERLPLEPLQAQLVSLMEAHPEYHAALGLQGLPARGEPAHEEQAAQAFMHLSLHLAVREQVGTDRPPGIRALHARLAHRKGDAHDAEHAMIELLAQALWEAQRSGRAPDETAYLEALRRLP